MSFMKSLLVDLYDIHSDGETEFGDVDCSAAKIREAYLEAQGFVTVRTDGNGTRYASITELGEGVLDTFGMLD